MTLTNEWIKKAEHCMQSLAGLVCNDFAKAEFSGFVTTEHLSIDEAQKRERKPLAVGMKWGLKWEYLWLFTEITVPKECRGKRIIYRTENGEGLIFVNKEVYGAIDKEHEYITLTECAVGGEKYEIVSEVYAGHGEPLCAVGEVTQAKVDKYCENKEQKILQDGYAAVWDEDIFGLLMDMRTLYQLRENLDSDSLRLAQINRGLKKIVLIVDFELPHDKFLDTVKSAREITAELLSCKNATVAPTVYSIGHSHLDLEWLWTLNETRRKAARTLGNQLQMIKQYDDYRYIQTQPWLLDSVKKEYPQTYKAVQKAVRDGKIIVEGGMWVESDANIPSGESLIRQLMYGKRFIKEEFGTESEMVWLPDVFGCTAALPQIMVGCGIKYFFNAKLPWAYNGGEIFPYTNFIWRGLDGTEILSHMVSGYANEMSPNTICEKWHNCRNKEESPFVLNAFGHGDGGGGATRLHMEYAMREKDLQGMPKVEIISPNKFFEKLSECEITDKYEGELYFTAHRGTFTSQAKTKKLNRKAEYAMRDAEIFNAWFGKTYDEKFDELWKKLLFNHFHDIIPGSSIQQVYERAEAELADIICNADDIAEKNYARLSKDSNEYVTVFNTLSWDRKCIVELPEQGMGAEYENGERLAIQQFGGKSYALAEVGAFSKKVLKLCGAAGKETHTEESMVLENALIRVEFDKSGEITRIYDKERKMDCLDGTANRFRMFRDMPLSFDAWDIDSSYEQCEVDINGDAEFGKKESGELFSSLTINKKINNSYITQVVVLRENEKQLDFCTTVEWRETHNLLKVYFDTNVHTDKLVSETQFGYIKRPNGRSTEYERDRYEVCQHKWSGLFENGRGFAVLNDSKYGISANENTIGLTLLKSAAAPDLYADKGEQKFVYSILIADDAETAVHKAYELNVPARVYAGTTEGIRQLFDISTDNVIIDTIKPAADGSDDVVVRMYEAANRRTKCTLKCGFDTQSAYRTDMLENITENIESDNGSVSLELRGFEVVTLRFKRK